MGKNGETEVQAGETATQGASPAARSLKYAQAGIKNSEDFANMMSAMISDIIEGKLNPQTANAAINAGGKLLKIVEMEYKYGGQAATGQPAKPTLRLASRN